ncbi:MAG: ABC1 kinase family protein [Saccharofermentanales bacterium]
MRKADKTTGEKPHIRNRDRFFEILGILRRHKVATRFNPENLRLVLEDLGPTFIKLGQILSMRPDMIPANYCAELAKLRTDVAPMNFDEVCSVVGTSCGSRLEELFDRFDKIPIGSASIAQAHYAKLHNGDEVIVKIQRVGIHEIMARDISLLRRAALLLKIARRSSTDVIDLSMVIDEIWKVAQEEMNFLIEAKNADEFRERNREVVFVTCPRIYWEYTTSTILVMEYIDGYAIDDKETLIEAGYDMEEIGAKLADNYTKQIIDDGFFHADPHPGNLKIRDGKIVFIDMGMMGRLSSKDQALIGKAIRAFALQDIGTIKDVVLSMGIYKKKIDHSKLYNDIDNMMTKYGELALGGMNLANVFNDLINIAREHKISMPGGVSMLGRGIATLEGVIADISPETNLIEITANRIAGSIIYNIDVKKEISELSRKLVESGHKVLDIPVFLADVLKMTMKGQAKINMELHSSKDLLDTFDRIASKLITGLIIAALFIGSSLMSLSNIKPAFMGFPVLAILGYVSALILCIKMVYDSYKNKHQ